MPNPSFPPSLPPSLPSVHPPTTLPFFLAQAVF